MTDLLPTLARIYGLTPSDVWDLTNAELAVFTTDMETITHG